MKRSAKRKATRKAKPGKFAGRSLHVTEAATADNPRTIADVLAAVERLAAATLASEPATAAPSRAARALFIAGECRRALAAGNAEGAAWAAWTLAELNGREKLDIFAEPVLRDAHRQRGTRKGGKTKRESAATAWRAATVSAVKTLGRECAAKAAWRWLTNRRTPVPGGIVTGEGEVLVFDGSDAMLSYHGWRRYLTQALAQGILRNK